MTDKDFCRRLKSALALKGITQAELAYKANLTEVSVSRYAQGLRQPKVDSIIKICNALDVSADYLLGLKENLQ